MTAPATSPEAGDGSGLVLDVADLGLAFGGVKSLDGVSLRQRRGEVLAVIGPNGAGKTSLFNCLTGAYTPQRGRASFVTRDGRTVDLLGRKPHVVNRLGVARTFQNIRLFPALTALENVKVGVESRQKTGPLSAMLRLPRARREDRESDAGAARLLELVGLTARGNDIAVSLPYGAQRRLEIARALGTAPSLLLLDEPAAGTNPAEKHEIATLIRQIAATGVSVLLIEHDMALVMSVAESVTVLNFGQVIASGTPAAIQRDPAVIEAYLGTAGDAPPAAGGDRPAGLRRVTGSGEPG